MAYWGTFPNFDFLRFIHEIKKKELGFPLMPHSCLYPTPILRYDARKMTVILGLVEITF